MQGGHFCPHFIVAAILSGTTYVLVILYHSSYNGPTLLSKNCSWKKSDVLPPPYQRSTVSISVTRGHCGAIHISGQHLDIYATICCLLISAASIHTHE